MVNVINSHRPASLDARSASSAAPPRRPPGTGRNFREIDRDQADVHCWVLIFEHGSDVPEEGQNKILCQIAHPTPP